jgi:hypothetical protein
VARRLMLRAMATEKTMITPANAIIKRVPTDLPKFISISNDPFDRVIDGNNDYSCTVTIHAR